MAVRPDLLEPGEFGFVEAAVPDGIVTTFSSFLTAEDCQAIDRRAYGLARTWYRGRSGEDLTLSDGTSLGHALELRATALIVRALRAEVILERVRADGGITAAEFRGVGPEWPTMAQALGIDFRVVGVHAADTTGGIPDPGSRAAPRWARAIGGLVRVARPLSPAAVSFVGTPRWSEPYRTVIADRWPMRIVEPGRRALVAALATGPCVDPYRIADNAVSPASPPRLGLPPDDRPIPRLLRRSLESQGRSLMGAVAAGRALGGDVAVATEDVSPSIRAFLLGFKNSGGRILTLEHGISGGYDEQVHSVADVLGVWGPLQARYHRTAGPAGLRVEEIGWSRLESSDLVRPAQSATADVIFFSQPAVPLSSASWPEDTIRAHRMIESYAIRRLGRRVAVKPHPATRAYMALSLRHARASVVDGDSLDLIHRSRVVVTMRSTTALEAMALGHPVVLIDPVGSIGSWDFLGAVEGVAHAANDDELESAIERLLSDGTAYQDAVGVGRAFARDFIRGIDTPGSAQTALVEAVSSLMSAPRV